MAIQFFGAVDRKDKKATGAIRSEYPCWYHPARIDELKESVERDERMIKSGLVDNLPNTIQFRDELERKKALLEEIVKDKPRLTGKDKDRVYDAYNKIGEQVRDLMPSYSDMQKGLASPHDEYEKDTEPCVNVDGFVEIARACGVPMAPNQKMITRKQATRAWKIMGKALNERSNVEWLRRDEKTGTYRRDRTVEQIVREEG